MGDDWEHLLNFRCTCCGQCCREPIVLVTDQDIKRVMRHTGQPANEVATFYPPDEIDWDLSNGGWIQLGDGPHIMGLIRSEEEGCQYLGDDDRCGIYEHRPVTCRRYPFDVEYNEDELTLLSISDSVECPYELDGRNTKAQIKALVDWEDEEERPYFDLVDKWNAKSNRGGPDRFFAHMGLT